MQGAEGKAAAVISSPATMVAQGIKTHSARTNDGGGGQSSSGGGARPSNPISGGVAAHSSRPSGGGGAVPSAAPPPRQSPANTPHASNARNNRTGGEGR